MHSTYAKVIKNEDGTFTPLTKNPLFSEKGIPCCFCQEPIHNFMALVKAEDSGKDPNEITYEYEASTMCPECRFCLVLSFENGQIKPDSYKIGQE